MCIFYPFKEPLKEMWIKYVDEFTYLIALIISVAFIDWVPIEDLMIKKINYKLVSAFLMIIVIILNMIANKIVNVKEMWKKKMETIENLITIISLLIYPLKCLFL
jgi:hypothetical protein